MDIFAWLNDQLLRMNWLSELVRLLIEKVFGLDMASSLGGSLHFFIYDVIKIFILLSVLIFVISWVQSYFPPERTRRILGGMRGFSGMACHLLRRGGHLMHGRGDLIGALELLADALGHA